MRWTLWCRETSGANADGEVVWSWRPDAGAEFSRSKLLRSDGGKRARSPGRARISRKTIAWGMPDVSGASAVNTRVHTPTTKRTRGCGCIGHPAFPAPSASQGGTHLRHSSGVLRRETAKPCLDDGLRIVILKLPGFYGDDAPWRSGRRDHQKQLKNQLNGNAGRVRIAPWKHLRQS